MHIKTIRNENFYYREESERDPYSLLINLKLDYSNPFFSFFLFRQINISLGSHTFSQYSIPFHSDLTQTTRLGGLSNKKYKIKKQSAT